LATLAASEIGIPDQPDLTDDPVYQYADSVGVFLCTSIREEITRRTLGVLWTTPISGLQLVIGKLTGRC
jgi:hypothetical protein